MNAVGEQDASDSEPDNEEQPCQTGDGEGFPCPGGAMDGTPLIVSAPSDNLVEKNNVSPIPVNLCVQ